MYVQPLANTYTQSPQLCYFFYISFIFVQFLGKIYAK